VKKLIVVTFEVDERGPLMAVLGTLNPYSHPLGSTLPNPVSQALWEVLVKHHILPDRMELGATK